MVLIPPDTGLRLRLQNEILPQPITPLPEIASDLLDLKTGQTFRAHIQEVLPENTYRALVAGKSVMLSLPESVKSGDVLDLVVIDRTPKTVIAQIAPQSSGVGDSDTAVYPHATFSRAAQMISTLLPAEGETPPAAELNRGLPLLDQPPRSGADLVPVLSKAVTASGLFYEAHQAQWVAGKLPLGELLQEPQGQLSQPQAQTVALAEKMLMESGNMQQPAAPPPQVQLAADAPVAKLPLGGMLPELQEQPAAPGQPAAQAAPPESHRPHVSLAQVAAYLGNDAASTERLREMALRLQAGEAPLPPGFAAEEHTAGTENARAQPGVQTSPQAATQINPPPSAVSMPDELRPLVQQQLDAAGTQRLIWHGEVWPGQTMQWRIEWNGERDRESHQSAPEPWATTVRLTTPRLGEVEAAVRLGGGGVHIALATAYGPSADDLRNGAPKLEQALAAAGVPLLGLTVKHTQEE